MKRILTKDHASGIAPDRPMDPNVGLIAVLPMVLAGQEIDPQVSVPIANGISPATVAAPMKQQLLLVVFNVPDPEEEPQLLS